MNFAEAALLIQGSACIYSRKVEFLYSLVFEVLNHVSEKTRTKQDTSDNEEEGEEVEGQDPDQPKEKKKKISHDDNQVLQEGTSAQIDMAALDLSKKIQKLNFGLPQNLQYEDHKKKDSTNFKLNSLIVHPSGALLLQDSDKFLLGQLGSAKKTILEQEQGINPLSTTVSTIAVMNETRPISINGTMNQTGNLRQEYNQDSSDDEDNEIRPSKSPIKQIETSKDKVIQERPVTRSLKPKVVTLNPWEPLDPHVEDKVDLIPYKKKKTMRIPKVIKNTVVEDSLLPKFSTFALGKLYNDEFATILNDLNKQNKKKRALERKNMSFKPEFEFEEEEEPLVETIRNELGQKTDSIVFHDIGGGDMESDHDDHFGVESHDDFAPVSSHSLEVSKNVTLNDNNLTEFVQSYEDFCKKHLETYLIITATSNQEAQILKRVQEWTTTIEPKLEQEATRKPYDIEEYGEVVLETFHQEETIDFDQVVKDQSPEEVCRIFLATLQLANWNNITIDTSKDFVLKKLNPKTKQVDSFRAPSAKKGSKKTKPTEQQNEQVQV